MPVVRAFVDKAVVAHSERLKQRLHKLRPVSRQYTASLTKDFDTIVEPRPSEKATLRIRDIENDTFMLGQPEYGNHLRAPGPEIIDDNNGRILFNHHSTHRTSLLLPASNGGWDKVSA